LAFSSIAVAEGRELVAKLFGLDDDEGTLGAQIAVERVGDLGGETFL
jgi:hypothetical protein